MKEKLSRTDLKKQAVIQSKLFDSLKGWLKAALNLTTLSLVLALFGGGLHPAVQIIGWIVLAVSITAALIIGLGLKRGRDQLLMIFKLLENTEG